VHDQPWQISLKLWIRFIFRKILAPLFFVKKYLKKTGGGDCKNNSSLINPLDMIRKKHLKMINKDNQ